VVIENTLEIRGDSEYEAADNIKLIIKIDNENISGMKIPIVEDNLDSPQGN
jgi:hypothetical protein